MRYIRAMVSLVTVSAVKQQMMLLWAEEKKVPGFICSVARTERIFTWSNTTHYGAGNNALPKGNGAACVPGFVSYSKTDLIECAVMYPTGWTCKNGTFNRDLTVLLGSYTDDCELRDVLSWLSDGLDEAIVDLDSVCSDLNDGQAVGSVVEINEVRLRKYSYVGAKQVRAFCHFREGPDTKIEVLIKNSTHYLTQVGDFEKGELSCSTFEAPPQQFKSLCVTETSPAAFCSLTEEEIVVTAAGGYNGNDCLLRELFFDDAPDRVSWHSEMCNLGGEDRRLIDRNVCSGNRRFFKGEINMQLTTSSQSFHIHHGNACDVRYYTYNAPVDIGAPECDGWVNHWYRNYFPVVHNSVKKMLVYTVLGDDGQTPWILVSGAMAGFLSVEGQLDHVSNFDECYPRQSGNAVVINRAKVSRCDYKVRQSNVTCTVGPSEYRGLDGCKKINKAFKFPC